MVLHHVAQRAGFFVVAGSGPDAFRFAHRDLHMIDVFVVPDRLEDAVGEPDDHQILNRLFAQIVIDPEDLRFIEDAARDFVDGLRGGQITPDRFFDDNAGIGRMGLRLSCQSGTWSSPSQTEVKELGGMLR